MPFRLVPLSSARNPRLQGIRSAAAKGRATEDDLLVIEGPHLLEELIKSRWQPQTLLFTPEVFPAWEELAREVDVETILIPARIFEAIAATESTQGVMALAKPHGWNWSDLEESRPALIVALDGIQDPGNAGTIIRSAEAFGATGIILLEYSARLSNGKLMRASAGSVFRMPVLDGVARPEFLSRAKENNWCCAALHPSEGTDISRFPFRRDSALIIGNEGRGVSNDLLARSTSVTIPTSRVESLNAASACSIALYEASRQRRDDESV